METIRMGNMDYQTIDNTCISILLGLLGIAITIFTVIYSFMESNKQSIRNLKEKERYATDTNPVIKSDLFFATRYMTSLKRTNNLLILYIVVDIIILAVLGMSMFMQSLNGIKIYVYIATFVYVLSCFLFLCFYVRNYYKRFKHN